jgi:hypothetical protein
MRRLIETLGSRSIGQVLQLLRSRISMVKGARHSRHPQEWIRFLNCARPSTP